MNLRKIIDSGTYGTVALHFLTCGLPLILIALGSSASLFKLPHSVMTAVLVIAGALLAASVFFEVKGCGCKRSKAKIACLIFCAILYTIGLAGHFSKPKMHAMPTEMNCH